MPRHAARIKHDEIVRMVKAIRACGMPIARVTFDGKRVDVIIGEKEGEPEKELDAQPEGYL